VNNIAGICNETRNVVGLMPHPERACELAIGSSDGLAVFESILKWGRESFVEDTLTTMAPTSAVLNK
jgi:CobB/CobQ-like glutamine amidotransferase domain